MTFNKLHIPLVTVLLKKKLTLAYAVFMFHEPINTVFFCHQKIVVNNKFRALEAIRIFLHFKER